MGEFTVELKGLREQITSLRKKLEEMKSQVPENRAEIQLHIEELDRFRDAQLKRCGEDSPPGCPPWTMQYPLRLK